MSKRGRPRAFDRDEALRAAMIGLLGEGLRRREPGRASIRHGGDQPAELLRGLRIKRAALLRGGRPLCRDGRLSAAPGAGIRNDRARGRRSDAARGGRYLLPIRTRPMAACCYLGAINCAPANKSVQDRMRTYRIQAPDLIRKRLERGVAEGDMPKGVDLEPLVSLYASFVHGLPVRARDGASRDDMLAGVTAAMAAWDGSIGPTRERRKAYR